MRESAILNKLYGGILELEALSDGIETLLGYDYPLQNDPQFTLAVEQIYEKYNLDKTELKKHPYLPTPEELELTLKMKKIYNHIPPY